MSGIATYPNPSLTVVEDNKSHWSHADHRRHGFHHLHSIARYGMSFRAARVMRLEKRADLRIAEREDVRLCTSLPWFSALVVIRGAHILHEQYAPDFSAAAPHSIQSITKTMMHLIIGRLVEQGVLDLSRSVRSYVPEIGSGYAECSVQQVLNMDVVNDYSEDFSDPQAAYYRHEEAMGWRLPLDPRSEETQRGFLPRISSIETANSTGYAQYKDANTDVLAWVAERAGGRPLRLFIAAIADAAGLEAALHITTDRDGFPGFDGGACLSARDLARYFSIFVRAGRGVSDESVGSSAFLEQTLLSGVPMPPPFEWVRYSNHLMVHGRYVGHGGWGGQYVMANLDTGAIGVFFSVIENQHAITTEYRKPVVRMLEAITAMAPQHE